MKTYLLFRFKDFLPVLWHGYKEDIPRREKLAAIFELVPSNLPVVLPFSVSAAEKEAGLRRVDAVIEVVYNA